MRKLILISVAAVVLLGGFFYWYQTTQASFGSLDIYSGSVDVVRSDKTLSGKTGLGIKPNDKIKVASGSRVAIVLKDGSVVRLEAGTELEVKDISYEGATIKNAIFKITVGRLWAKPKTLAPGANFRVETPKIEATVRGTSFNTDYLNQVSIEFVYKHQVDVNLTGGTDTKTVYEGEIFRIRDSNLEEDFKAGPVKANPSDLDNWFDFNEGLDDQLDSKLSGNEPSTSVAPESSVTPTAFPASDQNPLTSSTPTPTPKVLAPNVKLISLDLTSSGTSIIKGESLLFKVIGTYSDKTTSNVTGQVNWNQSSQIGSFQSSGWYRAVFTGSANITASLNGVVSNAVKITITEAAQFAPQLTSIRLTYTKQSQQNYTYFVMPTYQFTATGIYSDNSSQNITNSVVWNSEGTAGGTINSSGLYAPETEGSQTISANYQNISGNLQISVP